MYSKLPNLVLGFHGCNEKTFHNVIYEHNHLKQSENDYDWLGHGIYFWEQGYERALRWAITRYGEDARVVGAVLDLGLCLNLTDIRSTVALQKVYPLFYEMCRIRGEELPCNKKGRSDTDLLLRNLDCAVIEQLHDLRKLQGEEAYDSVRGVFVEGKPAFPGSAIAKKTHIQICIVNPNCIKGYFNPIMPVDSYRIP
ncbi:MAG: hypothetical protein IJ608_13720 [Lachnospiraceae bacterium]|nr:hypothetical protein [Lachnospiraceae bacterium]